MTGLAAGEIPEVQGVSIVQRGFHDIGKLGGSRKTGWANQHEEKPVAKLQPTTCVISQIWGDNQQHKFLTKVWMHPRSDHSHHIWKWSESHSSSVDTNVSPGVTKRLHTPTHIQGYWQLRLMGRQTVLKQLDADLNNSITAAGYHQASGWVHVHAADVVFALVERGQRHSTTSPRRENVTINKMWLIWGKKKPSTHSSSLIVSKQVSHIRTGNSKPMMGYVERLELHFPQTAFPHFLQWCCGNTDVP